MMASSVDPTGIAPVLVGYQPIVLLLHHGPDGSVFYDTKIKILLQGLLF